jgi:hypothetical protein
MKVEYKQSFQEWEKEYVARAAWLREKYKTLLTVPKRKRCKPSGTTSNSGSAA